MERASVAATISRSPTFRTSCPKGSQSRVGVIDERDNGMNSRQNQPPQYHVQTRRCLGTADSMDDTNDKRQRTLSLKDTVPYNAQRRQVALCRRRAIARARRPPRSAEQEPARSMSSGRSRARCTLVFGSLHILLDAWPHKDVGHVGTRERCASISS